MAGLARVGVMAEKLSGLDPVVQDRGCTLIFKQGYPRLKSDRKGLLLLVHAMGTLLLLVMFYT